MKKGSRRPNVGESTLPGRRLVAARPSTFHPAIDPGSFQALVEVAAVEQQHNLREIPDRVKPRVIRTARTRVRPDASPARRVWGEAVNLFKDPSGLLCAARRARRTFFVLSGKTGRGSRRTKRRSQAKC